MSTLMQAKLLDPPNWMLIYTDVTRLHNGIHGNLAEWSKATHSRINTLPLKTGLHCVLARGVSSNLTVVSAKSSFFGKLPVLFCFRFANA